MNACEEKMAFGGITLKAVLAFLVVAACLCRAEGASVMLQGYILNAGGQLVQGAYRFTMQADCNLVVYKNNVALWSSGTFKKGTGCYFYLQSDGNGVVYDGAKKALFATGTCCRNDGPHYIIMQCDGNVVMYNPNTAIWATGTNTAGAQVEFAKPGFKDLTAPQLNTEFPEQHVDFTGLRG